MWFRSRVSGKRVTKWDKVGESGLYLSSFFHILQSRLIPTPTLILLSISTNTRLPAAPRTPTHPHTPMYRCPPPPTSSHVSSAWASSCRDSTCWSCGRSWGPPAATAPPWPVVHCFSDHLNFGETVDFYTSCTPVISCKSPWSVLESQQSSPLDLQLRFIVIPPVSIHKPSERISPTQVFSDWHSVVITKASYNWVVGIHRLSERQNSRTRLIKGFRNYLTGSNFFFFSGLMKAFRYESKRIIWKTITF